MLQSKANQGLSEDQFDLLLDKLLKDQEFREKFFANPRNVLEKLGINLMEDEITKLKNFNLAKNNTKVDLNDKLVLCSSSGY